jgi:hypothetical protein
MINNFHIYIASFEFHQTWLVHVFMNHAMPCTICYQLFLYPNLRSWIWIPDLAIGPLFAHDRNQSAIHSIYKYVRSFFLKSNALKLGWILDRWQVMNSLTELFDRNPACVGQRSLRKGETNYRVQEIIIGNLSQSVRVLDCGYHFAG